MDDHSRSNGGLQDYPDLDLLGQTLVKVLRYMCCITFLLRVQAGLIAPSLQLSGREKHGGGGGGRCGGGGV